MPGEGIERDRQRQRDVGAPLHQPEDDGKKKHQHDVERQHVHVDRAESQEQRLDDGDVRLLEKIHDSHFFRIQRVLETGGDVGNLGEKDREQKHVRDINLPDPPQDARGGDHEAGLEHRASVNERCGVARDENENFGGVRESVIADREPGQEIGRQMIDEDQPQRQPAKQVEPQFALAARGKRNSRYRCDRRGRDRIRFARKRWSGNSIGNGRHLVPSRAGRLYAKDRIGPQVASKIAAGHPAGAL